MNSDFINFLIEPGNFTRRHNTRRMTIFGLFISKKLISRTELSRKTGITENRMYNLCENEKTEIRGKEVHLIALALEMEPNEIHSILFPDVELPENKNQR